MFHKPKTRLYFAPHQDDELLTMGIDISSSIQKKDDVHVILCTDGSKSGVRKKLNDGKTCSKHEGTHIYDLSIEEFIQARDREFTDSCLALGVAADHIHIAKNRDIDGSLSVKTAESIIRHYVDKYGKDIVVCTISPNNGKAQHRDHKALGQAAENLLNKGFLREVHLFIEPYHFAQIVDNPRLIPVDPTIKKASAKVADNIKKAIASYSYWNPDEKRYAVGYHSVTTEFNDFLKTMNSYSFIKKNRKYMTLTDKLQQRYKKWSKLQKQKQFYYSISTCDKPELNHLTLITVNANDTEAYKEFCEKASEKVRDKDLQRLNDGSSFWALTSEAGEMLTSGWLAYKQHFYIGETDYGFDMDQSKTALLFDFNTKPEHRGQGLYGLLLRCMIYYSAEPEHYIIYTSPDNQASARGILKAGFTFDGVLSASDNSMKKYLKKENFTSIKRKYEYWGLKVIK